MKYCWFILVLFCATSCIEIVDDLTVKSDGSGTFKYTINLSSSKVKVNSLLALDSLNGKKVPSVTEIEKKIYYYRDKLEKKEGISNVKVENNFNDFIFKFQGDFESVAILQKAIKEIVAEENKSWVDENYTWAMWDGQKFIRRNPKISKETIGKLKVEDIEGLKRGSYISITRFDKPIEKAENPNSQISANRLAVMLKTTPYMLTQNAQLLENTISFGSMKKEVKN